jgi:hypothetical protein
MKTVILRFRGGVIPEAELEMPDGPTQPEVTVPTPGAFGSSGYRVYNFRFTWMERDEESQRDVYIFQGIDA